MAQQSQAIHQLLDAEKKASEIVDAARKRKGRRLKQARTEAAEEIEACRKEKNDEYSRTELEQRGTGDVFHNQVRRDTEVQLAAIHRQVFINQQGVIDSLLTFCTAVQPELHKNLQL